jgi:hypothetical protein
VKRLLLLLALVVPLTGAACTSVLDLQVGQCFDEGESGESIGNVNTIDCAQPHVREVFAVLDYPADSAAAFPGENVLSDWASDNCLAPFQEYVGVPYEQSKYFILYLTPSTETWASGDREVVCTLNAEGNAKITGSKKGANE